MSAAEILYYRTSDQRTFLHILPHHIDANFLIAARTGIPKEIRTPVHAILKYRDDLLKAFGYYLNEATLSDQLVYCLPREIVLSDPPRADACTDSGAPPLQLLGFGMYSRDLINLFKSKLNSLPDDGGVRGLSSLHILQAIMMRLTNDPNAKPCDYLHMIAGTDAGGFLVLSDIVCGL